MAWDFSGLRPLWHCFADLVFCPLGRNAAARKAAGISTKPNFALSEGNVCQQTSPFGHFYAIAILRNALFKRHFDPTYF